MNNIECPGLDGSNPLHFLASLGVMRIGSRTGIVTHMHWQYKQRWQPVYRGTHGTDVKALSAALCQVFVPDKVARARSVAEHRERQIKSVEIEIEQLTQQKNAASGRAAKAAVAERIGNLKTLRKRLKKRIGRVALLLDNKISGTRAASYAVRQVFSSFPVTSMALHLDDITKGGLTGRQLRECWESSNHMTGVIDLAGLASSNEVAERKGTKVYIARTHFSFSNNNSGKQLLKDFVGSACLSTPERFTGCLNGDSVLDRTTGLGWDPASQRSYALQFRDPQDEVESQTALNALAFVGLSLFTVCPEATGRSTAGFARMRTATVAMPRSVTEPETDDDEEQGESSGSAEYFTWPLWESPLSEQLVSPILNRADLHVPVPDPGVLSRVGVDCLFRSQRISVNKRSFFAPSRML